MRAREGWKGEGEVRGGKAKTTTITGGSLSSHARLLFLTFERRVQKLHRGRGRGRRGERAPAAVCAVAEVDDVFFVFAVVEVFRGRGLNFLWIRVFFCFQEKRLRGCECSFSASRARTERYLCLLRGSRGNAGEEKGAHGERRRHFFFQLASCEKRMVSSLLLSPLEREPSRLDRLPSIVLFYLERGQGLVAAPHGVNERGEHPSASVSEREREEEEEKESGVVVERESLSATATEEEMKELGLFPVSFHTQTFSLSEDLPSPITPK